jgi:hypothetical protein
LPAGEHERAKHTLRSVRRADGAGGGEVSAGLGQGKNLNLIDLETVEYGGAAGRLGVI